jgi:dTDP-4-dehydrorhamnose reductase
MKKILIFGSTGLLGSYLYDFFFHYEFYMRIIYNSQVKRNHQFEVFSINRDELDVLESYKTKTLKQKLIRIIKDIQPDYIFNCIGLTNKIKAKDIDFYIVNSYFPYLLSEIIENTNIKVIHPSTDCVFSGNKGNYFKTDAKDPKDIYGKSKSLSERNNFCVIRASIIGHNDNSGSLLDCIKNNREEVLIGYKNHYWNGLTCLEYAKFISEMILEDSVENHLIHVGCNKISKYNLLKLYTSIYEINKDIKGENKQLCDRSLVLDIERKNICLQLVEMKRFEELKTRKNNILYSNEIKTLNLDCEMVIAIPSIIKVSDNKIYGNTNRSFFTRKERLIQTLDQLKDLNRNVNPKIYKIVLEQSNNLNKNEIDLLSKYSDYLILFEKDDNCNYYSSMCSNKSLGEIYVMKEFLGYLENKEITVCKFSGRYNVNKEFKIENYYLSNTAKQQIGNYCSVFYSLHGKEIIEEYIDYIKFCLKERSDLCAEYVLTNFLQNKTHKIIDNLGVCGLCAVDNKYFEL